MEQAHIVALQNIQLIKAKYPELRFKETNKTILKCAKNLPQVGEWLRRPKICLRIDDFIGMKIDDDTRDRLL